jgi:hypothetical protein
MTVSVPLASAKRPVPPVIVMTTSCLAPLAVDVLVEVKVPVNRSPVVATIVTVPLPTTVLSEVGAPDLSKCIV